MCCAGLHGFAAEFHQTVEISQRRNRPRFMSLENLVGIISTGFAAPNKLLGLYDLTLQNQQKRLPLADLHVSQLIPGGAPGTKLTVL